MSQSRRWSALGVLVLVVAACSSSTGGTGTPVATAPPVTVPTAPPASVGAVATATSGTGAATCPTAATVGAALGITVPAPVTVPGGAGQLPNGATGIACDYHAATYNVIVEIIDGASPLTIDSFSARFPAPPVTVSGVGDQARSFQVSLGGGKDNEGVVATKGSVLVAITATATPATLAQVEALVTQLL